MIKKAYNVDIKVGDVVLGGKFKNQRMVVEEFGTNDIGQPTVNGKSLLAVRIEKTLPDSKKSSETLAKEIAEMNTESYREKISSLKTIPLAVLKTIPLAVLKGIANSYKALAVLPVYVKRSVESFSDSFNSVAKPRTVKLFNEGINDPEFIQGIIREGATTVDEFRKALARGAYRGLRKSSVEAIPAAIISGASIYGGKKLYDYYKNKENDVVKTSGLLDTIYQNSFNEELEKLSQDNSDQKSLEAKARNLKRVGDYVGNYGGGISLGSGLGSLVTLKRHPKTSMALASLSIGSAIGGRVGGAMINRGKVYSTALQAARENVLSPDEKDFLVIKDPRGKVVKKVYNALPSDKRALYKKRMADLYGWKLNEFTNKQD